MSDRPTGASSRPSAVAPTSVHSLGRLQPDATGDSRPGAAPQHQCRGLYPIVFRNAGYFRETLAGSV